MKQSISFLFDLKKEKGWISPFYDLLKFMFYLKIIILFSK